MNILDLINFKFGNWDWDYWSKKLGFQWNDWKDGRIEKNQTVLKGYKQENKKPIFIHSVGQ